MRSPTGEYCAETTMSRWPIKVCVDVNVLPDNSKPSCPSESSASLTTNKSATLPLVEMMRLPHGENAQDKTGASCPASEHTVERSSSLQRSTVWSLDAVASKRPSGEKTVDRTPTRWPVSVQTHSQLATSQTFAVRSSEAVAACSPSGANAAERTPKVWPTSERTPWCPRRSQIIAVVSREAVNRRKPSGENATQVTQSLCPHNVCRQSPVSAFQSLAVKSADAVATTSGGDCTTPTIFTLSPSRKPAERNDSESCNMRSWKRTFNRPCPVCLESF
mmetsp:Transcript_54463/g.151767  ORF Transcript_54463/g.151767 Transcript_54463/m.151767 type:complete len:276 (-) Transcript_54463:265-1092(-)